MSTREKIDIARFGSFSKRQQRHTWRQATHEGEWAAAKGPLGSVILKQRGRGHRADTFAAWLMGALIVTILAGLSYYIGVPLWQKVQDGERRAYLAEVNLLSSQLDDMDQVRDVAAEQMVDHLDFTGIPRSSGLSLELTDLHILPDGQTMVAVGTNGGETPFTTNNIIRSTDGGENWEVRDSNVLFGFTGLRVFPDGQTMVAFGKEGVLSRSIDGGETWVSIHAGTTADLFDLLVLPNGQTLIAVGDNGIVTRSTDGGKTWGLQARRLSATLLALRALRDGRTLVAVGDKGISVRSTDGGETWVAHDSGVTGFLSEMSVLPDDRTIFALGDSGEITGSNDSGITWKARESGTTASLYNLRVLADGQTLIAQGSDSQFVRSTDGGDTWELRQSGVTSRLNELLTLPDGETLVAVGGNGIIIRSSDSGDTWGPRTSGVTTTLHDLNVLPDERTIVAVGENGVLTRSINAGDTWEARTSGVTADLLSLSVLPDGRTLVALGKDGVVSLIAKKYWDQFFTPEKLVAGSEGDATLRAKLDNVPNYVKVSPPIAALIRNISIAIPPEERLDLETQLVRAQAAADQIASGGFSLDQRRDDFAGFMKVCRDGAASRETSSDSRTETTDGEIRIRESEQIQTDVTTACATAYVALREAETQDVWQVLSERAPQAVLLLFLLATLGALFRYNVRLAGFYYARADALELMQDNGGWTPETLADLGAALAADKVAFGKSNTPSDQALEMAKAILANK